MRIIAAAVFLVACGVDPAPEPELDAAPPPADAHRETCCRCYTAGAEVGCTPAQELVCNLEFPDECGCVVDGAPMLCSP